MKNISLEKERIQVDYSAAGVPESVRNFRPDVYKDGDRYCCLLGNDSDGIFGCGNTLEEAMKKWDEAYWIKRPVRKD
jgi:hypothetical protein